MAFRYRQPPEAPATLIAGEAAVVTPQDSRLHLLDRVATRIWELCGDEGRTLDELAAALCDEFDAPREHILVDTAAFLDEAVQAGVLLRGEVAESPPVTG